MWKVISKVQPNLFWSITILWHSSQLVILCFRALFSVLISANCELDVIGASPVSFWKFGLHKTSFRDALPHHLGTFGICHHSPQPVGCTRTEYAKIFRSLYAMTESYPSSTQYPLVLGLDIHYLSPSFSPLNVFQLPLFHNRCVSSA